MLIPDDGRILFFERDRAASGFLSHFHTSPFTLDGEDWPTVEHFYQCQKGHDPAYKAAIRESRSPGRAKRLATSPHLPRKASGQSWFRKNKQLPRADWAVVKRDIMRRADRAKYDQNPDLLALLCATGEAEIIEDSPFDAFWGIGADGQGQNWAGRILMELRATLCKGIGQENQSQS